MPKPFNLPEDGGVYAASIFERCESLIQYGIWDIHVSGFKRWLRNFHTPEEQYFSACILDSFIFRSAAQTEALLKQLLQRVLPDLFRMDPPITPVPIDWRDRLRRNVVLRDPGIRFVMVVGWDQKGAKSSPAVARMLKRSEAIEDESWVIYPWQMEEAGQAGPMTFIFIDDFLGTGVQFDGFARTTRLEKLIAEHYVVYAPLAATARAVQTLGLKYPGLRLAPVETLEETHSVFSPVSTCFKDEVNSPEGAREFYLEMLCERGCDIIVEDQCGFGDLSLVYAFQHGVPVSTLPIIWWDSPTWNPLVRR